MPFCNKQEIWMEDIEYIYHNLTQICSEQKDLPGLKNRENNEDMKASGFSI